MRKFLITVGLMLLTIPTFAQDNIPTIVIPQAEAAPFTVERIESAGYHINTSADGTFRVWIGRDGFQLVYADMIAKNGIIDLIAYNVWLGNGNYTLWICLDDCTVIESWLGPVELVVEEPVGSISTLQVTNDTVNHLMHIHWSASENLSWLRVWSNDRTNEIYDKWTRASYSCSGGECTISAQVGSVNGVSTTLWIQGWGAGGFSEWKSVTGYVEPIYPPGA